MIVLCIISFYGENFLPEYKDNYDFYDIYLLYPTDEEIISAYQLLASNEGIFCEPASAASLAGLILEKKNGSDFHDKTIVCIVTGNGLKDPENAIKISPASYGEYQNDYESVEKVLVN